MEFLTDLLERGRTMTTGAQQIQQSHAGIDLGGGRTMPPEDVLEGHFRRMTNRGRACTVQVHVADDLYAAIVVLAPELAPLTGLAEDLAHAMPEVRPAPQFRQDLHQALERTHRQHSAQRVLGTRARPETLAAEQSRQAWMLLLFSLLALLTWFWTRRQTNAP